MFVRTLFVLKTGKNDPGIISCFAKSPIKPVAVSRTRGLIAFRRTVCFGTWRIPKVNMLCTITKRPMFFCKNQQSLAALSRLKIRLPNINYPMPTRVKARNAYSFAEN